jgi:serine/threonine protein kinase
MAFSVENVCGFLIRSQLMTPDAMRTMYGRWQSAAGDDVTQLPAFLKWLVAGGYVTEYQAHLLGQGHSDNFFLNQYKILERIGRGRMAGVFKAVHSLGQVVAIKVLPPSRARDPQMLGRFQREAQLAMRLKHANVVRSFQVGEAGGVQYLVMEYLEGETLDELLRCRGTLPPAEACRLVYQTLLGLQHLHEQGMVHRDIKPANLFLAAKERPPDDTLFSTDEGVNSADCVVKILDIGLAREMFEEAPRSEAAPEAVELTSEGMLLGTPDYLAPEQARDPRRSDIRADIYSAGCVLYHLLAGSPPFPDRSLFNQIMRHATEQPRPLRSFNPAIPEGLEQIVAWMMAKQPEQRYATPERAAKALKVFLLAGADAATLDEAPAMRSFLTWLETEAKAPVVATPVKSRPVAVAPVVARPAPVRAIAAAPVPIDVELVPPTQAPKAPKAPEVPSPEPVIASRPALKRDRKGLLVGIIIGAVVLSCGCAGVVGWAVSQVM